MFWDYNITLLIELLKWVSGKYFFEFNGISLSVIMSTKTQRFKIIHEYHNNVLPLGLKEYPWNRDFWLTKWNTFNSNFALNMKFPASKESI